MDNLNKIYINALQHTIGLTSNSYLNFLKGAVEKVSNASNNDDVLSDYNKTLSLIASSKDFALDSKKTNEFSQILGEAQFYLICKNIGVNLDRIKEGKDKTPDFKFEPHNMHFEVKTLSVVAGDLGIKNSLEDSLDANISIEEQLKEGKTVAIGETVIQPYSDKPYKNGKGTLGTVIDTLIEKTSQNIKSGQYPNEKSFLVVNLSIIPPFRTENYVLRPAYCDDYLFNKSVSGDLWMMAFANPGMPVLGIPEFEGKPCVEMIMEKFGILNNPDFKMVSGILFMVHPWRKETEVWGLYRNKNFEYWNDNEFEVLELLYSITKNNWNDDMDTNGWQLQGCKEMANK